jgi:hypothetical protein
MFAIPIFGLRGTPAWIRAAAWSGLLMTLLNIVFSVLPIIDVKSSMAFTMKITAVIVGANLIGAGLFAWRKAAMDTSR